MTAGPDAYENRWRGTAEEAVARAALPGKTRHVTDNGDGTFSVLSHIVCEWCDYCEAGGPGPFPARADPYVGVRGDDPDGGTDAGPVAVTIAVTDMGRYPVLEADKLFPTYEVSSPHFRGLPTEPGVYRIGVVWRPKDRRWDVLWVEEVRLEPTGVVTRPGFRDPGPEPEDDEGLIEWLRRLRAVFALPMTDRDKLLFLDSQIDRLILHMESRFDDDACKSGELPY